MCVDVSNYVRVRVCISMLACVCAYEHESLVYRDTWFVSFLSQSSRPFLSPTLSNFFRLRLSAPIRSAAFRSPVRGNGVWRREPRSKNRSPKKRLFAASIRFTARSRPRSKNLHARKGSKKCYNNVSMQLQL